MYLRDLSGTTLEDLSIQFDQHLIQWGGASHQVTPQLEADVPNIRFGEHEVFVGKEGLSSVATFFDIPPKFLARLDRDQQQYILRTQIERSEKDLTVHFNDSLGITEIRKAGEVRIMPHRLVDSLLTVFPADAPVVDSWVDHNELRIDVIFPETHALGTQGDPARGDISRGGLRVTQDRKLNGAPALEKLIWRLVCTNGMELPDASLKVEARGNSEREIHALFEAEIARAVDSLEEEIQHFYSLRDEPVGNDPTGALRRAALEQNLPVRTVGNLEDLVPALVTEANGGTITMFDVVNLMTNQANNPSIDVRSSTRRNLQRAGGNIVTDHAERCGTCHSRL